LLEIIPLQVEHIQDVASLACARYSQLKIEVPELPSLYSQAPELHPRLAQLVRNGAPGAVAIRGGRLVGFLGAWQLPSFRGIPSTYSPEWAHAAEGEDRKTIYEEMYRYLASLWVSGKYGTHYISLFANDEEVLKIWHWLGFGMFAVDAIRGLDPIASDLGDCEIRPAKSDDIEAILSLDESLWQHMRRSPVFQTLGRKDRSHFQAWIADPVRQILLALNDKRPIAFFSIGPANEEVSTIVVDEDTTSIYRAFTTEQMRGRGIATALLNRVLELGRTSGYARCAVDFEPMNPEASRFWPRYFKPVCYSLSRTIDGRFISK
jgi:GNAT superfamily N-acetyltransferase